MYTVHFVDNDSVQITKNIVWNGRDLTGSIQRVGETILFGNIDGISIRVSMLENVDNVVALRIEFDSANNYVVITKKKAYVLGTSHFEISISVDVEIGMVYVTLNVGDASLTIPIKM